MIQPTIGRRVWYWPSDYDRGETDGIPQSVIASDGKQACDAGVVYVHGDRCVNLLIADHNGYLHRRTSVTLLQDDDKPFDGVGHAAWMPYQTGQAKAQSAT